MAKTIASGTATLTAKQLGYIALRDQGFSIQESKKTLGYSKKTNPEPHVRSWYERMQQGAAYAISRTMRGHSVGDSKLPSASDVISAARVVLDRTDPIVTRQQIDKRSINIDIPADRIALLDGILGEFYRNQPLIPLPEERENN